MTTRKADPFPSAALDANRRGELTTDQHARLRGMSRYARQSALIAAGVLLVAAIAMASGAAPSLPNVLRMPIMVACLGLAAFSLLRGIVGLDALTRDLRRGVVQSIDGAVGKRLGPYTSAHSATRAHWLDVGDKTLRVSRDGYDATPDAGVVRAYFLPRSGRVVNLERLPNHAATSAVTPQAVLASLGAAVRSHSRRELNEIRATMAPLSDAISAALNQPASPPPPADRDPRPLGQAILGTWQSPIMTVDFSADGRVSATMFNGMQRSGRWSVDHSGRLQADVMSHHDAADAWVEEDQLTIVADGTALTFTRSRRAPRPPM